MPIYEFRCAECGRRFEKLCPLGNSGENLYCPGCGATGPKRVMSTFRASGGGNNETISSGPSCSS